MISLITSLYKSEKYLPEFIKNLDSFLAFTQENHILSEHVIIANEPSAQEIEAFKKYSSDSRINFVKVGRETLYASWNRGVGLAKGDILGFWNVDDIRYPNSLVEGQNLIEQGAEVVYFPFKINRYLKIFGRYFLVHRQTIKDRIPEFTEQTMRDFLYQMNGGPFFLFTKAAYEKVGPFDEQFKICGDFDWFVRAVKVGSKLVKASGLAGEFRIDGGGLSTGGNIRQIVENNVVFTRSGRTDRIKLENSGLAKEYQVDLIYCQGKTIKA